MGCWNKTCGISRLHIMAGDPVYVFVLEEGKDSSDRCYSTALFSPVLLPFESVYDDYGGGQDSSGPGLELLMAGLSEKLIEMEEGENEYHDIPVNRKGFTVEKFFEAVHEGRLAVPNWKNSASKIDFVMLRKDVVDHILENWSREHYVGKGQGNCGWDNNYIEFKFSDIVADVPAFLDRLEEKLNASKNRDKMMTEVDAQLKAVKKGEPVVSSEEDKNKTMKMLLDLTQNLSTLLEDSDSGSGLGFGRGLESVYKWEERHLNKVSWYLLRDDYRFSRIVNVPDVVMALMSNGERDRAQALLVEHLKAIHLNQFYTSTRNIWAPGCHEGSQSSDHDGYRVLIEAMTAVLDAERAERAEEDDIE